MLVRAPSPGNGAFSVIAWRNPNFTIYTNWCIADASLINPIPEDYRQAAAKVRAFADQPITRCEAVVAVLALRLGLEIWTYDHHFDVVRVGAWR